MQQYIAAATAAELDGIELWLGHLEMAVEHGHSREEIADQLKKANLTVPAIATYARFDAKIEGLARDSDVDSDLAIIHEAASWATALGSERVRTFAGQRPSQEYAPEERVLIATGLQLAAEICATHQVKLAVEIHNHTMADRAHSLQEMLEMSGHPAIELIYDPFNLYVDQVDRLSILESYYERIGHVHFKNYTWNRENWSASIPTSILAGDCDHLEIVDALERLGYKGSISLEYFGERSVELAAHSAQEIEAYLIQSRGPHAAKDQ
ncbi:3-dehydroshikimate dehydratase [Paenibacillus shirakamiensis]|uniref:3-dehydroshikimate dehydratase n=1 Tax=Paenibacillus shirakamiensis TaxID=1265935 RepID=A0ABS4JGW1_9BACL|nr:sugar phosphate isomerase/epimerase family protein [Paenibacillus shirakamiensis]MBP2000959.1 3-dehydroshikimate dehydratase [Paenibacillus shirakamiensis]